MNRQTNILIILLAIVALGFGISYRLSSRLVGVKSGQYQAVFLENGQVYFGKLTNEGRNYAKLSEVYYLKFSQDLQQGDTTEADTGGRNLNLIRLGGEAHGPEREMHISKQSISFYENLKSNSPVMQAILKAQK